MKSHHITIIANDQGFIVDDGKEARQIPKEMDLPLLVAVTWLEAVLRDANEEKEQ